MNNNNDLNPYKPTKFSKWPTWLKVLILKVWTSGAIFYFVFMSFEVFSILPNLEDRWLVLGLILILGNEYFINLLIKSMVHQKDKLNNYAMFIKSKYSIVANIFYVLITLILTIILGSFLLRLDISLSKLSMPNSDATWDPFTFGFIYYFVDSSLIFIVNLIKNYIKKRGVKDEV